MLLDKFKNDPLYKSLLKLRQSAIDMNMNDLAICYGWSIIRIQEYYVMEQLAKVIKRKNNVRND